MKILANVDLMIRSVFSESYDHRLSRAKIDTVASFHPWGNRDSNVKWLAQDHTAYFNYFDSTSSFRIQLSWRRGNPLSGPQCLRDTSCVLLSPEDQMYKPQYRSTSKQESGLPCRSAEAHLPGTKHATLPLLWGMCALRSITPPSPGTPLLLIWRRGVLPFPTSTLFIHSSSIVAVVVFPNTCYVSQCIYFSNPELREERYRDRDGTSEWVHIQMWECQRESWESLYLWIVQIVLILLFYFSESGGGKKGGKKKGSSFQTVSALFRVWYTLECQKTTSATKLNYRDLKILLKKNL